MDAKKRARKQTRVLAAIRRDLGISGSDKPTEFVCICNAGLMNGLSEEEFLQLFLRFGSVENVIMPTNKSYAFAVMKSVESAVKAVQSINNCETMDRRTLYAAFVDSVPDLRDQCVFDPPPGLDIIEDFLVDEEEEELLAWVDQVSDSKNDLDDSTSFCIITVGSSLKHRRVLHFGYEFNYATNAVDPEKPLPDKAIPKICLKFVKKFPGIDEANLPDQLTVNVYEPGQGIPNHVDTHSPFSGPIFSLSLGSPVVMQFRHQNRPAVQDRSVVLNRKSLTIFRGESRYLWSHGIVPRKLDLVKSRSNVGGVTVLERGRRMSLTFRKVNPSGICNCDYPAQCDYQNSRVGNVEESLEINEDADALERVAEELERNHVLKVYNSIADHFHKTRSKAWPGIVKFLDSLPPHSLIVDVGCGNGKYVSIRPDLTMIGFDVTLGLLRNAQEKGEVFQSDCLAIGARSDSFDAAICIAVVHHFATESRRRLALKEILRILKPGAKGLVYVWAKEQELKNLKSYYLKTRKKNKPISESVPVVEEIFARCEVSSGTVKLPVHKNRSNFKHSDLLVPWTLKKMEDGGFDKPEELNESSKIHHRFYHVFSRGELFRLAETVEGLVIDDVYYEEGNWCLVFSKK
ncbi:unnamed protein product [Notodromas monacha]|uniref:tRNA (carboxymethyluridine(34)-5-O)-methyltransferase n=1 Tax=Notodromas monacha TaxID=399045 RepID=A0A7R9BVD1_9CRUS|nr:unnamed protein product [Notodromas monacha]CAG0922449.1 unnamed protein product [Notodromas monacha]